MSAVVQLLEKLLRRAQSPERESKLFHAVFPQQSVCQIDGEERVVAGRKRTDLRPHSIRLLLRACR